MRIGIYSARLHQSLALYLPGAGRRVSLQERYCWSRNSGPIRMDLHSPSWCASIPAVPVVDPGFGDADRSCLVTSVRL